MFTPTKNSKKKSHPIEKSANATTDKKQMKLKANKYAKKNKKD